MAAALIPFLFFLLITGLMVAMFTYGYRQWTRSVSAWKEAATSLGLQSAASSMFEQSSMSGRVRDMDVRVHTERRQSGDNKKTFTVYTVHYLADGPAVSIKRERGFGVIKRLLNRRDIEVGDPVFDQALVIDGEDEAATVAFLTPTRRHAILSLMEAWPTAELTNSRVMVARPGLETSAARIVSTINRLVDTAMVVGEPMPVDAALELEARGDLALGAAALSEINAESENSYTRLLEAQARMSLGDRERAATLLSEVESALPDDREVMALRDMIAREPTPVGSQPLPPAFPRPGSGAGAAGPESPPPRTEPPAADPPLAPPTESEPAPEPVPVPEPEVAPNTTPSTAATPLDAAAIIADLFGSNRMGHEVESRFDEAYRGRTVQWSGEVSNVRPYRGDRDFGNDPGTKATILIGHLGDGRLVTSRVEAIVQLPAGVEPGRGTEVAFTGTLIRVDRFMRNLYVAGATLASP